MCQITRAPFFGAGDADREMHLVFRNLDELAWQSQLAEDEAPTRSLIQSLTEVPCPNMAARQISLNQLSRMENGRALREDGQRIF